MMRASFIRAKTASRMASVTTSSLASHGCSVAVRRVPRCSSSLFPCLASTNQKRWMGSSSSAGVVKTTLTSTYTKGPFKQIDPTEITKRFNGSFVSFIDANRKVEEELKEQLALRAEFENNRKKNGEDGCDSSSSDPSPIIPAEISLKSLGGFYQAPKTDIGKNIKNCDPRAVQVYSIPELITAEEEAALLKFTNLLFDRLPFQQNHTDNLIFHFKEFYRSQNTLMREDGAFGLEADDEGSGEGNGEKKGDLMNSDKKQQTKTGSIVGHLQGKITREEMERIRAVFDKASHIAQDFLPKIPLQDRIHFLRLDGDGFIKAHADESTNSSGIVAGMTLGSGRVMTLSPDDKSLRDGRFDFKRTILRRKQAGGGDKNDNSNNSTNTIEVVEEVVKVDPADPPRVHLLLAPRSFYLLTGNARYDWHHSVDWVKDDEGHMRRIREGGGEGGAVMEVGGVAADKAEDASRSAENKKQKAVLIGGAGSEVEFHGEPTGMIRDTRTALIWRGIPPMELLMRNSPLFAKRE